MDLENLSILNSQPIELPGPGFLHELIKQPCDLPAIEHLENGTKSSLSYHEFHTRAELVAQRITRICGNSKNQQLIVPVLIPQSPLLYISLLGILRAGGAFCPLNIDAPPERVKFILKDVSAKVVLVSKELASRIPSDTEVTILVIDQNDEDSGGQQSLSHRHISSQDLAYVMYTSGSTGTPKGVGLSHRAATQALLAHERHIPKFSRFLQFAAPTFDVFVFETFFPLFRGSTLISVRREEMVNDLPSVLREMNVDACELTPTVAGSLLRKRSNAPALNLLLTIGEMLNASVVKEFGGDSTRSSMLWAMYGPTEATIHCTLQPAFPSASSTGIIGIPLDTVSCFVIQPASTIETTKDFKILPRGEVGELAVGGHQLADGYLNRPEQTDSTFISTPYGRVYRTGDKARLLKNGTLECLGRLSEGQVKLRGQRIELGEVEEAILRTDGCHNAVAAVVDSILVAFCVTDAGVNEELIFSNCRQWLPQFMVPGELVLRKDFPRLPSGKVDKKRLQAEFRERRESLAIDNSSKPQNEKEERVLAIVSQVLACEANMQTKLASVGVDSLTSIRLASILRDNGFEIATARLLSLKSIKDLSSILQERPTNSSTAEVNISLLGDLADMVEKSLFLQPQSHRIVELLPCTPLQSAMLAETARNSESYCNEIELEAVPGITPSELSDAFYQLVQPVEVLRSGFIAWRDGFVSIIFDDLQHEPVNFVTEFHHNFRMTTAEDFLRPFRVQVKRPSSDNEGLRVLIHIHHALYDGWSLDMLLQDLSMLLKGKTPGLRRQFREVLNFQQGVDKHKADDLAVIFWSDYLLGWSKQPFPKLNNRSQPLKETRTLKDSLRIGPTEVERVLKSMKISPQTLFQAALAVTWSGILGSSDITLGSVTSGRNIAATGIDKIIGPCIASLPIRIKLENMADSMDLLTNINSSNRAIMSYSTLSLSDIGKLTKSHDSLYDVLFVYQESLESHSRSNNLLKEIRHVDHLESKMLVEVEPQRKHFQIQLTYHSDAFPDSVVHIFNQQFKSAVQHILRYPQDKLPGIRASLGGEMSTYNPAPEPYHGIPDLARLFESVVIKFPRSSAICFAESLAKPAPRMNTVTYETLNIMANRIAHFIESCTEAPGQVIAILMEKSVQLYASILGVVKSGCGYLPISPSTPKARIQEIFRQAGVAHCLTDGSTFRIAENIHDVAFHNLDTANLDKFSTENLNIEIDTERIAYVIYTSGTTGVPKGVAVTQLNIVSNIQHLKAIYPYNTEEQSRLLQACSQAFDVSVFEIFFTWLAGMCLCAASNDILFEDLEHAVREFHITHLSLTPTVASLINRKNVPTVKFLVTAGEPMTQSVLDNWGDLLWQGYGPSETTNICSVKRMERGEYIEHLGWVFPNTSIFVMELQSLAPVPIGWVGELCFGGDQVAHGYLNLPETTAEKFIEHHEFGRLYRSGDMGRMLPDGSLIILGRVDDQIKLRGQRIETGEIDSQLTTTKLVTSAVTTLVQRQNNSLEQLATFYVPVERHGRNDCEALEIVPAIQQHLLSTLQSRLPSYMVPSYLIPVESIPLTLSGKVDRRRLKDILQKLSQDYLEAASGNSYGNKDHLDWDPREIKIADAIANALSCDRSQIGRWTPFATIGLDSLLVVKVSRELRSSLNKQIPISAILQHPNITLLSRYLEEMAPSCEEPTTSRPENEPFFSEAFTSTLTEAFLQRGHHVEQILPCTPLQEAMLSRGQGTYVNNMLFRIHNNPESMKSYWQEMCQRHGILRTCFVTTDNNEHAIAQLVLRKWSIDWKILDATHSSLKEAMDEHLNTLPEPLDSRVPPLSFALITFNDTVFLSLICHHSLYDGVAMENLWKEVECLAKGYSLPNTIPYEPFLREVLRLPKSSEEFWLHHFAGFYPSLGFSRTANGRIQQCTHATSMQWRLTEIQKQVRKLGISLLAACQAAWANVLVVCQKSEDICFGNVVSGRTLNVDGLERLVAPCFNTIPIRLDLSPIAQGLHLLKYIHQLNGDMMSHQFTPLRMIQKVVKHQRRGLFDSMLLLQQPPRDLDESVWTLEEDSGDMDIPVVCEVIPYSQQDSVSVKIHYDKDSISEEAAADLSKLFKYFFQKLLISPHSRFVDKTTPPFELESSLKILAFSEEAEAVEQEGSEIEHWTETETSIRIILADLSKVPTDVIRRHTTIFKLGLDSINAVQVASLLRKQGYIVSASEIIELASCAGIASRLLQNDKNTPSCMMMYDLERFSREASAQFKGRICNESEIEAVLPCTPMQNAMLTSFVQSEGQNYLNAMTYELDHTVQMDDLIDAWGLLHHQHTMLRTGFVAIKHKDSAYAMIRYRAGSLKLPLAVLDSNKPCAVTEWEAACRRTSLEHTEEPNWKIALTRNNGRCLMHILIHHALYDAESLDRIFDALALNLRGDEHANFGNIETGLATVMSNALLNQEEAQKFWEAQAGKTVINKFPVMTPLRQDGRTIMAEEMVSRISFSQLQSLTKALEISIQAALQAAWTRVLASYLGEPSLVFGVTLSGRTSIETQDVSFPCINTVPIIATNLSLNQELLKAAMEFSSSMHKFQHSPLSQVQKWLGHPASPVFDTLLAYQKRSTAEGLARPWNLLEDKPELEYPVSLEVVPDATDGICLRLTFFSTVLPVQQARLLLRQFDTILEHIICHPEQSENDLYKDEPSLFAITPAVSPVMDAPVQYMHEFVQVGALNHSHKIALEFCYGFNGKKPITKSWTYGDLDRTANRVANLLLSKVSPGSIIAIQYDKCPEAYFSILGILKAGCSFVALDPNAPKARKEFIMQDSDAPCLLMGPQAVLDFETLAEVICISETGLQEYPDAEPSLGDSITPDSTCYCLYTSGTTGTPKGCEITHENAVQAMMAFQELFRGTWDQDSRCLQFASLHFDVSVLEQYWSWSVGITMVSAPKDVILDDLTASINGLGITHIDLTPSLARLVHPDDVPSLCKGVFITGGEQLKQEILDVWGPKAVIYNAYGPTEATIGVTMYQRVPINGRPSNIGRQFSNVGTYIFQAGTEIPVLRGGVGELCISGKLVGKGYLKRPELTVERFPTLEEFGERIYRTGDLVRILHDGCFEFLGRADDQVKLRGQRLEIGEINHVIRTTVPDIQDIATIVTRHASFGKDVLVSFIVGEENRQDELSVLPDEGLAGKAKAACRAHLPSYMEPTYFLHLPYIPLSPNNKAEVKILKTLFGDLTSDQLIALTAAKKKSLGHVDKQISDIVIRELASFLHMNVADLNETINIFDVGIDSITAIQLATQLKAKGLQNVSPATILRNPVVADLAHALRKEQPEQNSTMVHEAKQLIHVASHRHRGFVYKVLQVTPADIEYIAPCSPLQEGMISRAMSGNEGVYFNSFRLQLKETASIDHLRHSWDLLISSQAVLRSSFINTTNGCVQVALKRAPVVWKQWKSQGERSLDEQLRKERIEWIEANKTHILHPLQLIYVENGPQKLLVVHIFHALYDGNSFDLMLSQLSAYYNGHQVQNAPSFVEALTYGPLWKYDQYKQFWVDHLTGWNISPIPQLSAPAENMTSSADRHISLQDLEGVRRRHGVTLQSVVLAAWVTVLQQYMHGDVACGVILSGRSIGLDNAEKIVGPLFNTLPFFSRWLPNTTWESLISRCHDFFASTVSFQHTPLQSIQKWCTKGRPLFNTLFTFQIHPGENKENNTPWDVADEPVTPDYPLAIEAVQKRNGELQLSLVAQGNIANEAELNNMLNLVQDAFTSMSSDLEVLLPEMSDESEQPSEEAILLEEQETDDEFFNHFDWTNQAKVVRTEIASLAGLAIESITSTTTILEMGLDSIDLIKLSSRLKKKHLEIPASLIMREQSIERICQAIQSTGTGHDNTTSGEEYLQKMKLKLWEHLASQGVDMDQVELVLPPTPLQESMVASMIQSDFDWYFNHDVLELGPEVDMKQLQDAWKKVVEESQILRTGFYEVKTSELDMAYCQVITRKPFTFAELQLTDSAGVQDAIEDAKQTARKHGGGSQLFQLRFATSGERRLVVVSIAHALYDGWSLNLMYEALEAAYEGINLVTTSPSTFIVRTLASRTDDAQGFWSQYLEGALPTTIPKKDIEPAAIAPTIHRHEEKASRRLSVILDFCRSQSISLQTLCQACWAVVLARETCSLDVIFGVVLSGRDFDGAENLMFPTINTVALRCILHGTASEFLAYLEESMADIREFQAYPLRKAQLAVNTAGHGLFNTLFMLQKSASRVPEKRLLTSVDGGSSTLDYPVCVEAEPSGDELTWRLACQSTFFSDKGALDLITRLDQAMSYMMSHVSSGFLSWVENGVKICGQPSVIIPNDVEKSYTQEIVNSIHDRDWNAISVAIRKALSQTSGVTIESVQLSTSLYDLGLDSISAIKVSTQLRKENIILKPRDLLSATDLQHMAVLAQQNEPVAQQEEPMAIWSPPQDVDVNALLAGLSVSKQDVQAVLPALPAQVHLLGIWQNTDGAVFYPEFCYRISGISTQKQIDEAWTRLVAATPILRTCFVATTSQTIPVVQVVLKPEILAQQPTLVPLLQCQVTRSEGSSTDWLVRLRIHHAFYDGVSLPALMHNFGVILRGGDLSSDDGLAAWANYSIVASTKSDSNHKHRDNTWMTHCEVVSPWAQTGLSIALPTERVSYLKKAAMSNISKLRKYAAQAHVSFQSVFLTAYAMTLWHSSGRDGTSFNIVFGLYMANRADTTSSLVTYPTLRFVPLGVGHSAASSFSETAIQVQRHITDQNEDTCLWNIPGDAGGRLSSFVNFLSLPNLETEKASEEVIDEVNLTAAASETIGDSQVIDWRGTMEEIPIRDRLPQAIDVEVAVQRDGSLDIGVFGPRRCVSEDGAGKLVSDIVAMLENVTASEGWK